MESIREIFTSNQPLNLRINSLEKILNENAIKSLTNEELDILITSTIHFYALEAQDEDEAKILVSKIISLLNLQRRDDVNRYLLSFSKEILLCESDDVSKAMTIIKKFLTIEPVWKIVSSQIPFYLLELAQNIFPEKSLQVLKNLADIINEHEECIPPVQSHQQLCVEIINHVSQLRPPANQKVEFMQTISEISSTVKKLWLGSSKSSAVLPCLAHIYTLIAGSREPPSPALASFLDVAPDCYIDIALVKLLSTTGFSEDTHVKVVAVTLCDWMLQWPKALRVSQWVTRLFRFLTINNRSSIVVEVISEKGPMLMERSIVPIIRYSTAPVLLYIILTIRNQELQKFEAVLLSALRLFAFLNHQSRTDPSAAKLRKELSDAFHIIVENLSSPSMGKSELALFAAVKDYAKPSELVALRNTTLVPPLFGIHPSRETNGPVVLDDSWLNDRTPTGKIGLINLGNTCYANAIVQALFMNHDFTRSVLTRRSTNGQVVLTKLQQVLAFLLCSFRAAYSPAIFIKTSRPPWFDVGRQQDCSEFLRYLIDTIYEQENAVRPVSKCKKRWTVRTANCQNDEGLYPKRLHNSESFDTEETQVVCVTEKEDLLETNAKSAEVDLVAIKVDDKDEESSNDMNKRSFVHQVFGGKMTTVYRCLACGTESHHQDFFTDLHLAFPNQKLIEELDVEGLLRNYLLPEKLAGDNRYYCDHCGKLVDEAERIAKTDEAPMHLLLTLMRFCYDRELQRRSKITSRVKYSRKLELPLSDGTVRTYVLYAVVVHSGITLDAGHYYTLARSSNVYPEDFSNLEKSSIPWYLFNDSQVTRTDFETLIDLSNKYPNDTPYLLWYRRLERSDNSSDLLTLPHELKRLIDDDNAQFVRERLQYAARTPAVSWKSPPDDDDEQGNNQGDILRNNTGSRFVF